MRLFIIIFLTAFAAGAVNGQASQGPVSFWTEGVGKLPFWDPSVSHIGEKGYIDTFSIAKNHFRVIHNDTAWDGTVEKFENGKWIQDIKLPRLANHNDYDMTSDVNDDGYPDFVFYGKWTTEVFLFSPQTKKFNSKSFEFTANWQILDKARGIFCNFFETKFLRDYQSQVYIFKDNLPRVLFYVKFKVERDKNDDEVFTRITIYESTHGGKDRIIKEIVTNTDQFEYVAFWKRYYKMLHL